jgi:hypothetical protein
MFGQLVCWPLVFALVQEAAWWSSIALLGHWLDQVQAHAPFSASGDQTSWSHSEPPAMEAGHLFTS